MRANSLWWISSRWNFDPYQLVWYQILVFQFPTGAAPIFFWQPLKGLYTLSSTVIHFESTVNQTAEEIKMFSPLMNSFKGNQPSTTKNWANHSVNTSLHACDTNLRGRTHRSKSRLASLLLTLIGWEYRVIALQWKIGKSTHSFGESTE